MTKLAVVILTYNEELHIARAIASVEKIASKIFIIDSYSSDGTVDAARRAGAHVFQRKFINHAEQLQWAIDNLAIDSEWVMRLDADEYIDAELGRAILRLIDEAPLGIDGINLNRRHIFMGRWIKHGGRYPTRLLRIWRKGAACVEQRWMDEHIVLKQGKAVTLSGVFADHNLKPISDFIAKHNGYSTREALQVQLDRLGVSDGEAVGDAIELSSRQAKVRRLLKLRLYNKLPFPVAAFGYFFFRYILQFGFLDGVEGLIYHFLQGFWYRFLVGAKLTEMDRLIRDIPDPLNRRDALFRFAGIR